MFLLVSAPTIIPTPQKRSGGCRSWESAEWERRCRSPRSELLENFARSTSKSAELYVKWATLMTRYLARLAAIRLEPRWVKDETYKRRDAPTQTSLNWPHGGA
jgi:hypothetical protein